ncbi:MAG TPA: penicillin-binding protein 2 [Patescibacteria group bacterium]|nr:penicillin-binding protein 2 [Patescibacteria group bacterium]
MRTKLRIFGFLFVILVCGLIARLFFWQVIDASNLAQQGQLQYQRSDSLTATRGSIYATDGSYLTTDEMDWDLYVTKPDLTENSITIASQIAPIINADINDIRNKIDSGTAWISLQHRVTNDQKKNIEALDIAGVGFDPEPSRTYPESSSSAHILGFVGKDVNGNDKGYFGLEGYYDLTLAGKPGLLDRESDANGTPIVFGNSSQVDPTHGIDLVTNIDKTVQFAIEKELANGLVQYGSKAGSVIMMDPNTGAILGMASSPSFDPGQYWNYTNEDFKDAAISNTFEPGSIFKPIVMASALDAGVVQPDTECDICANIINVDGYPIDTWDSVHHPNSSMTDVIVNSDNIGMTFVGQKLGQDKLYDYLAKFGFGKITGIDLQGEVALPLRTKDTWSDIDTATTTFGQGIAVTPIQILRAIGIIANGGQMVKPEVVKEIKNGTWSSEIKSQIGPRVISQNAAGEITDMMVHAVTDGEAKWAAPAGFSIAGKTGTAQIPVSGHYDPTKTIASFVGFAPAKNPKFVMLVTLQSPTSSEWGSETAAPLWFHIAEDLFPYFGISPNN